MPGRTLTPKTFRRTGTAIRESEGKTRQREVSGDVTVNLDDDREKEGFSDNEEGDACVCTCNQDGNIDDNPYFEKCYTAYEAVIGNDTVTLTATDPSSDSVWEDSTGNRTYCTKVDTWRLEVNGQNARDVLLIHEAVTYSNRYAWQPLCRNLMQLEEVGEQANCADIACNVCIKPKTP